MSTNQTPTTLRMASMNHQCRTERRGGLMLPYGICSLPTPERRQVCAIRAARHCSQSGRRTVSPSRCHRCSRWMLLPPRRNHHCPHRRHGGPRQESGRIGSRCGSSSELITFLFRRSILREHISPSTAKGSVASIRGVTTAL